MGKNILIIDDEKVITKSLQKLLTRQGYNVTTAQSGKQALESIKNGNFDLIVCDIRMPDMDGIKTIKEIRAYLKRNDRKSIPEVFITGYADEDKYEKVIELKVADYIYKPFDIEEFMRVVKKNLG